MATYNMTRGGNLNYPAANKGGVFRIENVIDFSKVNSGTGAVQNDVVQAIPIPAHTFVQFVYYKWITNSSNLADVDIGDGATADGFLDGLNGTNGTSGVSFSATFTEGTPNTTAEAFSLGKYYATADTIDLKVNTNATIVTGRIVVGALCVDCNPVLD